MEWWEKYFNDDYLKLCWHTEQTAPSEVAGILRMLQIEPPAKILDLCCGFGRHSVVLANKGYDVTGLDLSERFLQKAREKADKSGVNLKLERRDMRDIQHFNEFDAVINLFTAFGFFNSESEDLKVLKGVAESLKSDGQFLIDTVNRDNIIHSLQPKRWNIDNGTVILEERFFDFFKSRLEIVHQLINNSGKKRRLESSFRLYTLTEMLDMFDRAGLVLIDVYGDFDGSLYLANSPRMILVARKKD
jgi:cyclopropane fatty-acyl-phospholipid synthase-like methyltransferase